MLALGRLLALFGASPSSAPAAHGPFYRVAQTDDVTRRQVESGELWGGPDFGSDIPSVDAWVGPLPADKAGIEFFTDTSPNAGLPPRWARWTGPRPGVRVEQGWAKIACKITVVRYSTEVRQ